MLYYIRPKGYEETSIIQKLYKSNLWCDIEVVRIIKQQLGLFSDRLLSCPASLPLHRRYRLCILHVLC